MDTASQIRHFSNIPTLQFATGNPRYTQSKSYMLYLTNLFPALLCPENITSPYNRTPKNARVQLKFAGFTQQMDLPVGVHSLVITNQETTCDVQITVYGMYVYKSLLC